MSWRAHLIQFFKGFFDTVSLIFFPINFYYSFRPYLIVYKHNFFVPQCLSMFESQ